MAGTCVVGLQWGDEAKGKIVDLLTDQHDFVVRYNGGANAGHTVVADGKTFKLSLLPTGVLQPARPLGHRQRRRRLSAALPRRGRQPARGRRRRRRQPGRQRPRPRHLPLPHGGRAPQRERRRQQAIGTTGRGIGPCYQDKVGRTCGIRVGELLYPDHLRQRLRDDRRAQEPPAARPVGRQAKHVRRRRAVRRVPRATASRCGRTSPTRARLLHEALRAGQAHPVRGGPGQPARRGPRHLSVRDQLEQLDGRRLERLAACRPGNSTASSASSRRTRTRVGRGPVPDGAERRPDGIGETHSQDRPRVRHRDRPAAPLRLVRRRRRALHRRRSAGPTNWP